MANATANLTFGYSGTDFKRTYALDIADTIAAADRNDFVRNAGKFAPNAAVNTVKTDLDKLEDKFDDINTDNFVLHEDGKGLSSNDFTNEHKTLLENLAKETNSAFDAQDVLDIFD